jgi:predicted HTH transcriptional regulator
VNPAELEKLIALGEGQSIEFKPSLARLDDGLRSLDGMVNADSGKGAVLFGVDDDGNVSGVDASNLDSSQKKIAQKLEKFDPPLPVEITCIRVGDRVVIALQATRVAPDLHEYDGRAHLREGSVTRRLGADERRLLIKRRRRDEYPAQLGQWVCNGCAALSTSIAHGFSNQAGAVTKWRDYTCPTCGGEFWPA